MNAAVRRITEIQEEKKLSIEEASREYRRETILSEIEKYPDLKLRCLMREIATEAFK